MNQFKTKKINNNKIVTIVNVGSYKVRSIICSFSSGGIKILWYWEKRQSRLDVINNEINNLVWISDTINNAIYKAELEWNTKSEDIIINPFFSKTFYYSKRISHKINDLSKIIWEKEISKILSDNYRISINGMNNKLNNVYGLSKEDLVLILWNIVDIKIDWIKQDKLFWYRWEDIELKMLNSFILKSDLEVINDISNYLWKNIIKIVPEDYSVTKIWNENIDILFLNIWNSTIILSLKSKEGFLVDSIKLDIWIWDLIKDIKITSNKSRSEIIKKLDREDLFKEEKKEFLIHFWDILIAGLKDMLIWKLCPNNFILIWWWANNSFIKDYLSSIDFNKRWVKFINKLNFLDISIDNLKKIEWVEKILNLSNVDLISQVLSTEFILNSKNNLIENMLKKIIKGYKK